MSLPAWLTPSQYAPLAGVCERTVRYRIERGEIPAACVVWVGTSKHHKHARLLTAKLIEHGFLVQPAVLA